MRILHIAGAFYPACVYGGPTETSRQLCVALAKAGINLKILTTNSNGEGKLSSKYLGWREMDGYMIYYANRWIRPDIAPNLLSELRKRIPQSDVIHLTGTYNWFLPFVAYWSETQDKPLVLTPRGSLIPSARGRKLWKKKLYDILFGNSALQKVTAFHATSEEEARGIWNILPSVRVEVIANGVEIPEKNHWPLPSVTLHGAGHYLLFLGRIHPYKQIEKIIEAFNLIQKNKPTNLWIVGNGDEKYKESLRKLAREKGLVDKVFFPGHVDGEEKSRILANTDGLILASKSENFGMSVAEALAHGTPCIVTKTAPWGGLEIEGCGFWVDDSIEALAQGMEKLLILTPEERRVMGGKGRKWMGRDFSWDSVAKQMVVLYESLVNKKRRNGEKPLLEGANESRCILLP
jgi:glycosyltransferase involved in cell wall biosynthesis